MRCLLIKDDKAAAQLIQDGLPRAKFAAVVTPFPASR